MDKCVNTIALNAYEENIEKLEKVREAFNQEVSEELYPLFEELENKYQEIGKKYGYSECDLDTFQHHIKMEW